MKLRDRILDDEILDVALLATVWNDGQRQLAADMAGEWIDLARTIKTRERRTRAVFDLARSVTYQAARREMRLPGDEALAA